MRMEEKNKYTIHTFIVFEQQKAAMRANCFVVSCLSRQESTISSQYQLFAAENDPFALCLIVFYSRPDDDRLASPTARLVSQILS